MNIQELTTFNNQAKTVGLIKQIAIHEGFTLTNLDGVKVMRWNRSMPRSPILYEPSIVIVCQGQKIGYLGDEIYHYNAQQFLVLSIPLPFESETIASNDEPMLAISIRLDLTLVSELVLMLDQYQNKNTSAPIGIISTPLGHELSAAVSRLLEVLMSKTESAIIGASIVREIHYRALTSEQGPAIRAALTYQNHVGKIGRALRRIHGDFAKELNVNVLAAEAGMSVAAFHANFKAVTSTSPMQYLKMTRLHKARILMIQDGTSASAASAKVGYESNSQFSREFKRFFGRPPVEDVTLMKQLLIEMPVENTANYVTTSH